MAENENEVDLTNCAECGCDGALPEELEALKRQYDEMKDAAQRIAAEFDNYKKRNQYLRADALKEGRAEALTVMLPVLDNMERAAEAGERSQDKAMAEGTQLILKQLRQALESQGVEEIPAEGEEFDPNWHNAVAQEPNDDKALSGKVAMVLQKGYRMDGKALRFSMVKVYS